GFESFPGAARTVKDATEIRSIERAAEITNEILEMIRAMLSRPGGADGVREIDIAQLIQREALARGAEGLGFETLAAGPARSWGIHAFPSSSAGPFATEGLSILDFGVMVDGYTSDVTLTVARGRLSREQERLVSLVEEAYGVAMEAAQPGATPQAVAARVDQVFTAAGVRMPHSLGHGIGIETHENPVLRTAGDVNEAPLSEGMVFTIEPGLYDPKLGGVRWENDVLITAKEARVLTRAEIIRI
ncbi:MAG TPA: M24 family metallopeptidase, partial [Spirochaetia bacterium]